MLSLAISDSGSTITGRQRPNVIGTAIWVEMRISTRRCGNDANDSSIFTMSFGASRLEFRRRRKRHTPKAKETMPAIAPTVNAMIKSNRNAASQLKATDRGEVVPTAAVANVNFKSADDLPSGDKSGAVLGESSFPSHRDGSRSATPALLYTGIAMLEPIC